MKSVVTKVGLTIASLLLFSTCGCNWSTSGTAATNSGPLHFQCWSDDANYGNDPAGIRMVVEVIRFNNGGIKETFPMARDGSLDRPPGTAMRYGYKTPSATFTLNQQYAADLILVNGSGITYAVLGVIDSTDAIFDGKPVMSIQ